MKRVVITLPLLASLVTAPGIADAKGCRKGASVGCATGHHGASKKEKEKKKPQAVQKHSPPPAAPTTAPIHPSPSHEQFRREA